jgi:hypothetical protein
MRAPRSLIACTAAALVVLGAGPSVASADRACGVVGRPFTDGGAEVAVRSGALRCAPARGLMRRYWSRSVDAFTRPVRLRHAGIRWSCRPTTDDFPYRWSCSGGGPSRDRFRVTARE